MKNIDFPRIQAVPNPTKLVFQLDGAELVSYNYLHVPSRPYLFPIVGPAGRYITRISHPHDPIGHRHHYSIWLAHHNINDVDFWSESDKTGKQIHQNFLEFEDAPDFARMVARVLWQTSDGKNLLEEDRQITVRMLESKQYFIDMDLTFKALADIHFGKTNFGLLGVRVAKTMGVHDGGGNITNSEGDVDESKYLANALDGVIIPALSRLRNGMELPYSTIHQIMTIPYIGTSETMAGCVPHYFLRKLWNCQQDKN
jgi:hypothetical protein